MKAKDLLEEVKQDQIEKDRKRAKEIISNQLQKIEDLENEIDEKNEKHAEEKEKLAKMLEMTIEEIIDDNKPSYLVVNGFSGTSYTLTNQ